MSGVLRDMSDEAVRRFANACAAGIIAANDELRRRLSDLREHDQEWFDASVQRQYAATVREDTPRPTAAPVSGVAARAKGERL